jgi:hypothetical protein
MKLFDQFQRTDYETARYAESLFTYMNRTARDEFEEVRKKLETWFSHYPVSEQIEMRARFRSDTNAQHQSAFFELLLHEVLRVLGCEITPHPTLPNVPRTPDFLVEPLDGPPFYIEAVLATNESADEAAAQARINIVYDVVDRKVDSSNLFLWIDVEGAPESPPSANRIASFLNKRLAKLDPDEVAILYETEGMASVPSWRYEHDGWILNFQPIPKKPEARNKKGARPIGAQSTGVRWVDHRTPIRDAIKKKASRYGKLELPYVIAVNALEFVDEIDIMEALFGKEQFTISFSQSHPLERVDTQMSRVPDGAWTSYTGPRNTRISAVLLATKLSPWHLSRGKVCLYHNPWAQKPYSSILTRLPQAVLKGNRMKNIDGESIGSILGLPNSWPAELG